MKLGPWTKIDGAVARLWALRPPGDDSVRFRHALIEKSPRVRIREDRPGDEHPPHLNWCYGFKGSGPDDQESRDWCDRVLTALGHELT